VSGAEVPASACYPTVTSGDRLVCSSRITTLLAITLLGIITSCSSVSRRTVYPRETISTVVSHPHRHSVPRTAAFRRMHSVGFPLPIHREIIFLTTTKSISGLNTQPASSIHPASHSHCRACTWTSLLTCRLHFGQVGLELEFLLALDLESYQETAGLRKRRPCLTDL
jgi:hypothetical protein